MGDRFKGRLYRALNPIYAANPLSGEGARRFGGRFNSKGTPALYAALDPATAIREANQVGDLQPTVLVSYKADLGPIFDAGDAEALQRYAMSAALLGNDRWRENMISSKPVPTQDFADRLIEDGFVALKVRSFAKGGDGLNMVIWDWSARAGVLEIIDDEGRLSKV